MHKLIILTLLLATPLFAQNTDWKPVKNETRAQGLITYERTIELFEHGVKPEWGYATAQQDTFVVIHPEAPRKNAPLYVVLHSAGHDVISCVKCTNTEGNHDIYHPPASHYALYVDCRANKGDWWWGGMHQRDKNLTDKNAGGTPMPVERRIIDTVKWTIHQYGIDPNRVYLCGNSMGGSGALGIGLRHGDLFAAIKANVPAGIEHAAQRMYFAPNSIPEKTLLPDPPVVIDYSGTNDSWSSGHDRFAKAMNDRKYPLHLYWGPFGHANNHRKILAVNDLINSFDWLALKKNEAYAVFTNASSNDPLPWPDNTTEKAPGQVNAWFRWNVNADTDTSFEMALYLVTDETLNTQFTIPESATADISIRRLQQFPRTAGSTVSWQFGNQTGTATFDSEGVITVPKLKITAEPVVLKFVK
jgi:predicted esterase